MAIEHSTITDPDIHEPKGVAAAAAGTVYIADGAGSGAWANQATLPSNTVRVSAASDFPAAVAGVRTLAADTIYEIVGTIDVGTDRFICSNNTFIVGTGRARRLNTIESDTTGSLFTATGVNVTLVGITLAATAATELITFDGANTGVLSIENVQSLTHTGSVATITNMGGALIRLGIFVGGTDGITFVGANNQGILIETSNFIGFSGTGIDFGTATMGSVQITGSSIQGDAVGPDIGVSGLAASANFRAGATLYLTQVDFGATSTPLSGITPEDVKVEFWRNQGIKGTHAEANGYVSDSVLTTTISASLTPVKVNVGTDFVTQHDDRFTVATDGRITYDGEDTIDAKINYAVQFTGASGTNTFNFYIAKNGTVVAASKLGREIASTGTAAIGGFCIEELATTDYVELWVENDGATVDCNVIDMKLMVQR